MPSECTFLFTAYKTNKTFRQVKSAASVCILAQIRMACCFGRPKLERSLWSTTFIVSNGVWVHNAGTEGSERGGGGDAEQQIQIYWTFSSTIVYFSLVTMGPFYQHLYTQILHGQSLQSMSRIQTYDARWLFSSQFWLLLKPASFFQADGPVAKIGLRLKPNHHVQFILPKSVKRSVWHSASISSTYLLSTSSITFSLNFCALCSMPFAKRGVFIDWCKSCF